MSDVNPTAERLMETEAAYLRELIAALKAAEAAYNQYAGFLARRYQLTERDRLDLETGAIQRDAAPASNALEDKAE